MSAILSVSNFSSNHAILSSFNYERRMDELCQKVKYFESKLGISKKLTCPLETLLRLLPHLPGKYCANPFLDVISA